MANGFQPGAFQSGAFQTSVNYIAAASFGATSTQAVTAATETSRIGSFGFQPGAFQSGAFQGTPPAFGIAEAGLTGVGSRSIGGATTLGSKDGLATSTSLETATMSAETLGATLLLSSPGQIKLSGSVTLGGIEFALYAFSPKSGWEATARPIGLTAAETHTVTAARSAVATINPLLGVTGHGAAADNATVSAVAAVVGAGTLPGFQTGAFQLNAFQQAVPNLFDVRSLRAAAVPVLAATSTEASSTKIRDAAAAVHAVESTLAPITIAEVLGGADVVGAKLGQIGAAAAAQAGAVTFAVIEGEVTRFYQHDTGIASFGGTFGLTPTATVMVTVGRPDAFQGGAFQSGAFQTSGTGQLFIGVKPAVSGGGIGAFDASTQIGTHTQVSIAPTVTADLAGAVSFSATHEAFSFMGLEQIFFAPGMLGLDATYTTGPGTVATIPSRVFIGTKAAVSSAGAVSLLTRLTVGAALALGALGRRGTNASQAFGVTNAVAAVAATIARPTASQGVTAGAAPTTAQVDATPVAVLGAGLAASPAAKIATAMVQTVTATLNLLGVGNRRTTDGASFGTVDELSGSGHRTSPGIAALGGVDVAATSVAITSTPCRKASSAPMLACRAMPIGSTPSPLTISSPRLRSPRPCAWRAPLMA